MASVGESVQIRDGAIDVTNGVRARAGFKYGDGGPLWCQVSAIVDGWYTGGKWGLPQRVTKVRCTSGSTVVWQVQPQDLVSKAAPVGGGAAASAAPVQTAPDLPPAQPRGSASAKANLTPRTGWKEQSATVSNVPYAIPYGAYRWDVGVDTEGTYTGPEPSAAGVSTKTVPDEAMEIVESPVYDIKNAVVLSDEFKKSIGVNIGLDDDSGKDPIIPATFPKAWDNEQKKLEMLNANPDAIQNPHAFPQKIKDETDLITAKYDYQIVPGDPRYSLSYQLEDKLKEIRASLGIPVHGNNNIARAVKYYMYNRFKVPDINLAHSKSVTYVFFTRPDLNLLKFDAGGHPKANDQTMNHTESAMVWRRNPELFKLLTNCTRCGDFNNFNFLLSNQVTSFDIQDETLSTVDAGKSWGEYTMTYGDSYMGRAAGEFTCNFNETSDYSIIHLMKLWITYIDNVSRGAWSPSYNLYGNKWNSDGDPTVNMSHVYTKTLDYAASAYVFKCGPDGEDVLYWSKYYGVFPVNTGANVLGWESDSGIGGALKPSIRFKYSYKRDMSPISLIEFNHNANIYGRKIKASLGIKDDTVLDKNEEKYNSVTDDNDTRYEYSFNPNYAHSSRPFVGTPFIEMDLADPILTPGSVDFGQKRTQIRLKFRRDANNQLTDDLLYRSYLGGRTVNYQENGGQLTGGGGVNLDARL